MASVGTPFKRLFVRNLLEEATSGSTTILALLKAAAGARLDQTESGKVLTATSGNGHSATFDVPADFTTTDAVSLISEIWDRYEEAVAKLIADGIATPTDTQIANEMLDKLRPVRSMVRDFTNLGRCAVEVES